MPSNAPIGSFRLFQDHRLSIDSAVALFTIAQAIATDAEVILDVGCGRGALIDPQGSGRPIQDLRAPRRTVVGIDLDPGAARNPVIDEFRLIEAERWPLDDASVDLAVCDWVLEHVDNPDTFRSELSRVLRPGGAFLARTVNRNSLLALGARAVPNEFHTRVLARLQPKRAARDVFPTAYAMNTRRALESALDANFDWAVSFHAGLDQYLVRWPRLGAMVAALETRLPRRNQMVLIVAARKRLSQVMAHGK